LRRLLLAMAFLAVAPPAAADTPTKSILHSDTHVDVRSDGGRYLVYQNDPSLIEIYDARTETTRDVPLDGNCRLHDIVKGRILVSCGPPEQGYLISAAGGGKTKLPGRVDWIDLGTRWVGGFAKNGTAERFLDLRTRRVVKKGSMPSDLDGANPKPLPFGVQNRMSDGDLRLDWFTKTFTPPFHSRLTLTRRPAHHKPHRLLTVRMDTWPGSFEVGSGMVTWTVGLRAYGFDVASRKRFKWTFPGAAPNQLYREALAAHTRHHVFFAVPVADGFELYVAPRPE
jgi:hypothetical protein